MTLMRSTVARNMTIIKAKPLCEPRVIFVVRFLMACSLGGGGLLVQGSGAYASPEPNSSNSKTRVVDSQDAVSTEQGVAFANDKNFFTIGEEGTFGELPLGTVPEPKEFHVGRQGWRRRFGRGPGAAGSAWRRRTLRGRWRRQDLAE